MILFRSDYATHQAIIDTSTKNTSFIKMAKMLKDMGIKNHAFMLVLTQPELKGVDPYDDNLDKHTIGRIMAECKTNPWYFFREILRIPAAGGRIIRYKLNRANLALIWLFMNNIHIFLTMPRQIGKTIGTVGLVVYMMYVMGRAVNVGLFAKDMTLRAENVSRLKELRNGLPKYMFLAGSNYNTDNQEGLEYKKAKNKYITFVAQNDKKKAKGQGRGQSLGIQHWDELAYYSNNELAFDSASAASDTAQEQIHETGIPAANIITTTAGQLSTDVGRYAHKIKSQCMVYTERMFDCENKEELDTLIKNSGSTRSMVYVEFGHLQLGKDDAWFKKVTQGKAPIVIACDYLNTWVHGSGDGVIGKELLDKLQQNVREPVAHTVIDSFMFRWYVDPELVKNKYKDIPFIIGSDLSDNVGRDFTTMVILDPSDMTVIATARCNKTNLAQVALCMCSIMEMLPRSILIPERNRTGGFLIDLVLTLMKGTSFKPFERIYNTFNQNAGSNGVDTSALDIELPSVRKAFGFNTSAAANSRDMLFTNVLSNAVERNYGRIYDAIIIEEMGTLTKRNGRIDHSTDGHDDMLVAYLIASWFILYGKNLYRYGLADEEILSKVDDNGENSTEAERIQKQYLRSEIKRVHAALENPFINHLQRLTFTRELDVLKRTLGPEEADEILSMHQAQKEAETASKPKGDLMTGINLLQRMYA